MTDIIETHGPQGSTTETVGRKPWKAPRLIDLDDDGAKSCRGGVVGDGKYPNPATEYSSVPNCYNGGDPAIMVVS